MSHVPSKKICTLFSSKRRTASFSVTTIETVLYGFIEWWQTFLLVSRIDSNYLKPPKKKQMFLQIFVLGSWCFSGSNMSALKMQHFPIHFSFSFNRLCTRWSIAAIEWSLGKPLRLGIRLNNQGGLERSWVSKAASIITCKPPWNLYSLQRYP